jgi:23S rRNA (uracil1939-C5)-methyltransferase
VVPIAECPIAAPLLVRAALSFADLVRRVAPQLRAQELSLFCDATESSLLATVFVRSAPSGILDPLARAMAERIPEFRGMELVAVPGAQSKEQAARSIAQWGESHLAYRAAGFDYRVDNGAFFQVNRRLVDPLVERVTARRNGTVAWDLFAGVGLFARKLTSSFERVVAVESAPAAIPGLEANLRGTSGATVQAWTLDFLRRRAPALTYVSCDPATLARDLRGLLGSGYSIESMTLADLFPQTFHLETVVHLRCA